MYGNPRRFNSPRSVPRWAGFAVLLGIAFAPLARAAAPPPERLVRQLKVMEGILDQVLVDSPNFLVFGKDNVRGLYLEELGVLFSFEASLTDRWSLGKNLVLPEGLRILREKEGEITIDLGDRDEDGAGEADKDQKSGKDSEEDRKVKHKKSNPAELYRNGKDELIQTLIDYGDTIGGLKDNQWVVIAAFLRDSDYFLDAKISRLILRAKVQDLRDLAAGRLNEAQAKTRIVEEEY